MTPQVIRILTECDTMLAETARQYTLAQTRLEEASPGFPAHTPGAGEPGGGKGYTAGSITDRLVIGKKGIRRHPELEALQRLRLGPIVIANYANGFANKLHLPHPYLVNTTLYHIRLLIWAQWVTRYILNHPDYEPRSTDLNELHTAIVNLHRTVTTWAYTPAPPPAKQTNPHLLPDDLTELWCRNHLRVGEREPRHRGYLCRWCDEMRRLIGDNFLPPPEMLELRRRQSGRIYERDIELFRKAWKDRNKRKRKKAG